MEPEPEIDVTTTYQSTSIEIITFEGTTTMFDNNVETTDNFDNLTVETITTLDKNSDYSMNIKLKTLNLIRNVPNNNSSNANKSDEGMLKKIQFQL